MVKFTIIKSMSQAERRLSDQRCKHYIPIVGDSMHKNLGSRWYWAFLFCICNCAQAATKTTLGDIANNILEVELATNSFLQFIFVTSGVGLIASSLYHFKLWWKNRQHRPISRPILFLLFGLGLIILVYIPMPLGKY